MLFRSAASIRAVQPSEYASLRELLTQGWTVPRVSLSGEGFLSSSTGSQLHGAETSDAGAWLDASLVFELGRAIVGD